MNKELKPKFNKPVNLKVLEALRGEKSHLFSYRSPCHQHESTLETPKRLKSKEKSRDCQQLAIDFGGKGESFHGVFRV